MFVLLAFFPLLLWAEGEGSNKVTTYEVSGTYTYSTDPNHSTYNLPTSGSLDLRKMAFTMCITLDNLPDGMHYEWKLNSGDGSYTFQPQPNNSRICYMGFNGDTNYLNFSIIICKGDTHVLERTFNVLLFNWID